MPTLPSDITETVKRAISEDIGQGDLTSALLEPEPAIATIVTRQNMILCGCAWFGEVFHQIDPSITVHWHINECAPVTENTELCSLTGPSSSLLTGERTALNFLQTLSATATITADYVSAVEGTKAKILDTRKTIPGLRSAQKYAVACGGGFNHRMGLYDAILIKENHIAAAGSIRKVVAHAREKFPDTFIEIEVENLKELEQALDAGPNRILLDNFSLEDLRQAVLLNSGCNKLEASGGVSMQTIREIAETGVDYISIGAITKDINAIDLSMMLLAT
ncbi:MAG: carboxylating nicotinate-nucleotide diphosphorylase [Gammaproteobacteria bacterium]|nr:MAG: carboxylating nicotinate-nucleotide diphosphorylase [Gammaproteobacteria bacterium]